MKDFGEFNIKPLSKGFIGDFINIGNILNVNIVVEDFKVGPSKFKDKGPRLDIQIIWKKDKRVTWVSSNSLIEMLEAVPKDGFPFTAKVVKEGGRLVLKPADN